MLGTATYTANLIEMGQTTVTAVEARIGGLSNRVQLTSTSGSLCAKTPRFWGLI